MGTQLEKPRTHQRPEFYFLSTLAGKPEVSWLKWLNTNSSHTLRSRHSHENDRFEIEANLAPIGKRIGCSWERLLKTPKQVLGNCTVVSFHILKTVLTQQQQECSMHFLLDMCWNCHARAAFNCCLICLIRTHNGDKSRRYAEWWVVHHILES